MPSGPAKKALSVCMNSYNVLKVVAAFLLDAFSCLSFAIRSWSAFSLAIRELILSSIWPLNDGLSSVEACRTVEPARLVAAGVAPHRGLLAMGAARALKLLARAEDALLPNCDMVGIVGAVQTRLQIETTQWQGLLPVLCRLIDRRMEDWLD